MKKVATLILAGAACALLLALPAAAADKPTAASGKTTAHKAAAMRSAWPAETLSGKIVMVDPSQKLIVVKAADGVTFDMVATGATHIEAGSRAITLENLRQYQNKPVSIKFVPERRGDVAESIRISG